jgi:hypothetical protein
MTTPKGRAARVDRADPCLLYAMDLSVLYLAGPSLSLDALRPAHHPTSKQPQKVTP